MQPRSRASSTFPSTTSTPHRSSRSISRTSSRARWKTSPVVSPDVGGVTRARELAKRIGSALAIVDKRREKVGEIAEMTVIGDVEGQTCIIVDDICDTAGTLCKAAEVLIEAGAKEVHSYISHGVLSGPAVERITGSVMKSLVVTDTIEPSEAVKLAANIRIVPTARDFCPGDPEYLAWHQRLLAVRAGDPRADLRGHVFPPLTAGGKVFRQECRRPVRSGWREWRGSFREPLRSIRASSRGPAPLGAANNFCRIRTTRPPSPNCVQPQR